MRPLVVFDLDGVLVDFVLGFSALASKYYRVPIHSTRDQTSWAGLGGYLSKGEKLHVWEKVDALDDWWETLEPLVTDEDVAAMHKLSNVANSIYVTNRAGPDNMEQQTERWLAKYKLPNGIVLRTTDKPKTVNLLRNQFEFGGSRLLGCIEDNPHNITGYVRKNIPCTVRDWQFNRDVEVQLPRVTSVAEFCESMLALNEWKKEYA